MKRDIRFALFLLPLLMMTGGELKAQNISSVRVYSNPGGARFVVDGLMYNGSQTFLWPAGSKHTIQFPQNFLADGTPAGYQESVDGNTRYSLSTWTLSNGVTPTAITDLVVVADPSITSIVMNTSVTYRVRIRFSSSPVLAPGVCSTNSTPQDGLRSGMVVVGGTCFGSDADVFYGAGSLPVLAYPLPGWAFGGWATNGGPPVSYSGTVVIAGPTTLVAQFILAKRVSFRTDPPGLNLLIDRTPTPTPPAYAGNLPQGTCPYNLYLPPAPPVSIAGLCFGDFDFIPGSSHTIGAASPQYDTSGNMWIIDSFSNGLKPNDTMIAGKDAGVTDVITAKFVPGVQASFLTSPGGLKLSIDNRSNWITYNFAWGSGTSHTISAADQLDLKGRRWSFTNWSNGGTATQAFTVSAPIRWTANFTALPQVILRSVPSGIALQVDGTPCTTPCTLDRPAGSQVNVTAPNSIPISDGSRYQLTSWSDGGGSARTVGFDTDQKILVLNYQTQFRLSVAGDPSLGATFSFDPPSPDQFFPQDSGVTVKAQTKAGYRFRRWDGDLSGSYNLGTVVMGAPRTAVALLDRVPYIAPAGIRNAAGATPDGTVAPGSLISITGESLNLDTVMGRTNPLAQALGDVTVTVSGRLLPLVFVSPQEIRAQLPSGLVDGDYSLTVHSVTQPDVVGLLTVARNSPGLFTAPNQDPLADPPLASAFHDDGTPVTAGSPAVQGETVTLYGTGFGPVNGFSVDGFPTPAVGDFKLTDPLQISTGDVTFDSDWAGAVSGQVGMMAVKFKINNNLPTATLVKLTVVVNGKTSNTVALPLQ